MALHVIILISDLLKKKGHKKLTGPSSRTTNLVLSKAVKTFLFNVWKLLSAALLCSIMRLLRKKEEFFLLRYIDEFGRKLFQKYKCIYVY